MVSGSEDLAVTLALLEKGTKKLGAHFEQSAEAIAELSQVTVDMAKNAADTARHP